MVYFKKKKQAYGEHTPKDLIWKSEESNSVTGKIKKVEQNQSNLLPSAICPPPSDSISPFDAIRRYDKDGNEYWSARELMEFMGYPYWHKFETPIQEAIENLELTGDKIETHIYLDVKVVYRPQGGGAKAKDYKLSRHGCYMIAICCDRRKPEVAMAKRYFTKATRENELRKQREAEPKKKTASEAIAFATQCLIDAGIERPVVSQYQLRQLAKIEPENAEHYENACAQLASAYVLENKPILVTKVGQMICVGEACACTYRLGLNRNLISFAKTINEKLIEIGLQEKDIRYKDGKPYNKGYVLTEAGKPWAISTK